MLSILAVPLILFSYIFIFSFLFVFGKPGCLSEDATGEFTQGR